MPSPTYPAAHALSSDLEGHFRECARGAADSGDGPVPSAPDAGTIETILSVAFWASLRREEGRSPRISLAYLTPAEAHEPLTFERPLPLDPSVLTRLAPAVERPSIHLGIDRRDGALCLWGTTGAVPASAFVVEVVEPGLLVVKRRRGGAGAKFANVAVLQGDRVMRVSGAADLDEFGAMAAALLGIEARPVWFDPMNVLVQLAVSMRGHGHGGTLLVVPDDLGQWRESIVHPIPYPVDPPYTHLAALAATSLEEPDSHALADALRRAVAAVAGLTAVDGATVLTHRYRLLAFGAKIGRRWEAQPVERVRVTEPVVGHQPYLVDTAQLGGTRHLSAAQFAFDQPGSLALVASQDGRFTVFTRHADDAFVSAHRMEALLM